MAAFPNRLKSSTFVPAVTVWEGGAVRLLPIPISRPLTGGKPPMKEMT